MKNNENWRGKRSFDTNGKIISGTTIIDIFHHDEVQICLRLFRCSMCFVLFDSRSSLGVHIGPYPISIASVETRLTDRFRLGQKSVDDVTSAGLTGRHLRRVDDDIDDFRLDAVQVGEGCNRAFRFLSERGANILRVLFRRGWFPNHVQFNVSFRQQRFQVLIILLVSAALATGNENDGSTSARSPSRVDGEFERFLDAAVFLFTAADGELERSNSPREPVGAVPYFAVHGVTMGRGVDVVAAEGRQGEAIVISHSVDARHFGLNLLDERDELWPFVLVAGAFFDDHDDVGGVGVDDDRLLRDDGVIHEGSTVALFAFQTGAGSGNGDSAESRFEDVGAGSHARLLRHSFFFVASSLPSSDDDGV